MALRTNAKIAGMPRGRMRNQDVLRSKRYTETEIRRLFGAAIAREPSGRDLVDDDEDEDPRDRWARVLHLLAATHGVTNLRKGPYGALVATFPAGASLYDIVDFRLAIADTVHVEIPVMADDAPLLAGQDLTAL